MDHRVNVYPVFIFDPDIGRLVPISEGMTLRESYAGDALRGILSNPACDHLDVEMITELAFNIADKMLEEREK